MLSTPMLVKAFGRTERGNIRPVNEDDFFFSTELGLYFVADGLGGHPGGEIASSLTISLATGLFAGLDQPWTRTNLLAVINRVNQEVKDYGTENHDYRGLGTTLTGVMVDSGTNRWLVHVGDSRLYGLYSAGNCKQLSVDQTLAMEAVSRGILPLKEAPAHPYWHVLNSCVGGPLLTPQVERLEGDFIGFLLCTDGLSNAISRAEIEQAFRQNGPRPETLVNQLVKLALNRGGLDNITAVAVAES
ncbi:MAG: PP2C family protein-serine/threonine phosphatase [Fidelibacterota bacterium]